MFQVDGGIWGREYVTGNLTYNQHACCEPLTQVRRSILTQHIVASARVQTWRGDWHDATWRHHNKHCSAVVQQVQEQVPVECAPVVMGGRRLDERRAAPNITRLSKEKVERTWVVFASPFSKQKPLICGHSITSVCLSGGRKTITQI